MPADALFLSLLSQDLFCPLSPCSSAFCSLSVFPGQHSICMWQESRNAYSNVAVSSENWWIGFLFPCLSAPYPFSLIPLFHFSPPDWNSTWMRLKYLKTTLGVKLANRTIQTDSYRMGFLHKNKVAWGFMRLLLRVKTHFLSKWECIKSSLDNEDYNSALYYGPKWREMVIERNKGGEGSRWQKCVP